MTVAPDTTRQRQDHHEKTLVEAEASERAGLAALAAAQAQAEFELTMGQILNMATGGRGPSAEWLQARKRAMLDPKELPRRHPEANRTAGSDV